MELGFTVTDILTNCLDPPDKTRIEKSLIKLTVLDALNNNKITPFGILLNQLGVEPEIGKLIFYRLL